jgi:DNA polymerase III subunit epsilon
MPSSLPSLRFLVLDTETTGFVPKTHHVIEYACIVMENGVVTETVDELLALPEWETIPETIQQLTQISPEDLAGKPTFADILPRLSSLLTEETILVGQNIPFDLGMLAGEGWNIKEHPWLRRLCFQNSRATRLDT